MPIIPLITRQQPLPNAPDPVLDGERRPAADFSPQLRGVEALASVRQPEMPAEALTAPFQGMDAVARAVVSAGGVLSALAIKEAEVESELQVSNAGKTLRRVEAEFSQFKAERPELSPSEQRAEWDRRSTAAVEQVLADPRLRRGARRRIQAYANDWQSSTAIQVGADATKEMFRTTQSAALLEIGELIEAGDREKFDDGVKKWVDLGILYPHQAQRAYEKWGISEERRKKEAIRLAERHELIHEFDAARQDPIGYEDRLGKVAHPGSAQSYGLAEARRLKRLGITNAVDQIYQGFEIGRVNPQHSEAIVTEADIDCRALGDPFLGRSPKLLSRLKEELARKRRAWSGDEHGALTREDFKRLVATARTYDPEQDPTGERYFDHSMEIQQKLPASVAGYARYLLWSRRTGSAEERAPDKTVTGYLNAQLERMFDPKTGQVPWLVREPSLDKLGRPTTNKHGQPLFQWKEEPALRDTVLEQEWRLRWAVNQELKEHPDQAQTIDGAKKILRLARFRIIQGDITRALQAQSFLYSLGVPSAFSAARHEVLESKPETTAPPAPKPPQNASASPGEPPLPEDPGSPEREPILFQ